MNRACPSLLAVYSGLTTRKATDTPTHTSIGEEKKERKCPVSVVKRLILNVLTQSRPKSIPIEPNSLPTSLRKMSKTVGKKR